MSIETDQNADFLAEQIEEPKKQVAEGPIAVQTSSKTASTVVAQPPSTATESGRGDVSASTIARMMGMATAAEFRVLEGKVDLLSTKVNSITGKLERISSALANAPTGSDLERIDVQISSLRTALSEAVVKMSSVLEDGIGRLQIPAAAKTSTLEPGND